jgi:alcohol dehydrogenase
MLPINAFWMMTNRIGLQGSVWFTTSRARTWPRWRQPARSSRCCSTRVSPLSKVNDVLAGMDDRDGGFTNFVIDPTRVWGWATFSVLWRMRRQMN